MPRLSVVIPTLQRSDTLKYALQTVLNQRYGDLEIVVQNNGRDPATERVVEESSDHRVKHFWSDAILPMVENWETALGNARGEFITFIGDDDGLMPGACVLAAALLKQTKVDILSWRPFCYYWPNYLYPEMRGRVIAEIDDGCSIKLIKSPEQLERFYRCKIDYAQLPMIYNSFVRRPVLDAVRRKAGRYFLGTCPDVTSGIVNAAFSQQFALVSRPISMTGLSHHSTGHNVLLSPPGHDGAERSRSRLGKVEVDPRLVPSDNLDVMIGSDMLFVRDRLFANDSSLSLNYRGLVQRMAAAINDRAGFYDVTLGAIRELATRYDIDLAEIIIPPRVNSIPALPCAETVTGPHKTRHIIDGTAAGLASISDAVAFVAAKMPSVAPDAVAIEQEEPHKLAVARLGSELAFGASNEGMKALTDGWAQSEAWGTWSVAKRATVEFALESEIVAPFTLEIGLRTFLYGSHKSLTVRCRARGVEIDCWEDTTWQMHVRRLKILPNHVGRDRTVELEFLMSEPRSPAQLGAGSDIRALGIGLAWLRCIEPSAKRSLPGLGRAAWRIVQGAPQALGFRRG
jgi:hypothetical protein